MATHYKRHSTADGGCMTACGMHSIPAGSPIPSYREAPKKVTSNVAKVTCMRCWRTDDFVKAKVRLGRPLDDPRRPTPAAQEDA